jgi:hypothetical protein
MDGIVNIPKAAINENNKVLDMDGFSVILIPIKVRVNASNTRSEYPLAFVEYKIRYGKIAIVIGAKKPDSLSFRQILKTSGIKAIPDKSATSLIDTGWPPQMIVEIFVNRL